MRMFTILLPFSDLSSLHNASNNRLITVGAIGIRLRSVCIFLIVNTFNGHNEANENSDLTPIYHDHIRHFDLM